MIILAGASGKLGGQIAAQLRARGVPFRALTRADFAGDAALRAACAGGRCVVSALSGLRPVIVDLQARLLAAAVAAAVPRFIPSDFSIDFAALPRGPNRNLTWRAEFRDRLDAAPIAATSVLNGAFMELLGGQAPFLLRRPKLVLCWGDPDQAMDWTTVHDVAAFTAEAALDAATPRVLRIAGDQLSARGLCDAASAAFGERFRVLRAGPLALFAGMIKVAKLVAPQPDQLYPPWQGMQYMHDMYAGRAKFAAVDNGRYPALSWTTARAFLTSMHARPGVG